MNLPPFAEAPGPGWTVRSHSDVDVVWEKDGETQYQFAEGHAAPTVPARRRVWPALAAMAVPASYGVVELVHHLWAIGR